MELTLEQQGALDAIGRWLTNDDPLFTLFGYAGTGKTTLARYAAEMSGLRVAYAAPTGKAASVLRRKGCADAKTIHRWLYNPVNMPTSRLVDLMRILQDPTLSKSDRAEAEKEYRFLADDARPAFERQETSGLRQYQLVICDEGSMVAKKQVEDLLSQGIKVLMLADPGQLPPVQSSSPILHVKPDVFLETIHRTAADNPILRLATLVRQQEWDKVRVFPPTPGTLDITVAKATTFAEHYGGADQVLVYQNKTRDVLNARFRTRLGAGDRLVVPGDKMVCLRNIYPLELYNGSVVTLTDATFMPGSSEASVVLENADAEDVLKRRISTDIVVMGALPQEYRRDMPAAAYEDHVPMDYGYALTVHKSQGSEWKHVTLWDDYTGGQYGPWLYTALTRAQERCTWIRG